MELEGLVNVDILVEEVTNIPLENHDPIPVFVTISDGHNFGDMDAERAESLAKRSATLLVRRFARYGGSDGGGRGQAAVVVDHQGVRRVVTAKHVVAKKMKGGETYEVIAVVFGSPLLTNKLVWLGFADENCEKQDPGLLLHDGASWSWGVDISWSHPLTAEGFGSKAVMEKIEHDFFSSSRRLHHGPC